MNNKDFPQIHSWYNHSVSYGETDAMGFAYHAEYIHFFERSRALFLRERGMSYRVVEERGIYLPVREASCRYRTQAYFDDVLNIHVGIKRLKRASIQFVYNVYKDDRTILVATGFTEHACTNKKGRPVRVPEWLTEILS